MRIKINSRLFSDLACVYFFSIPLWRATIFKLLPAGNALLLLLLLGLLVFAVLTERNGLEKYRDILLFYIILSAVLGEALLMNPDIRVWLTREFGIKLIPIQASIFVYPVIRLQKEPGIFLKNLKKAAVLLGLYYAYMVLEPIKTGTWTYQQFGTVKTSQSNMSWSYGVLLVILVFFACAIAEKKWKLFIPVPIGLILILMYGSRGTVVAFLVATVLIVLIRENNKLNAKKFFLILFGILLVLFVLSDPGISLIQGLVSKTGLQSRFVDTVMNILEGKNTMDDESSGRDQIWKLVISMIKEKPMGYGPMGHRNAIYMIGIKWGYSHNLFLDWLAEYGVVIGSIMILGLFFIIFRQFKDSHNKTERLLLIVFIGLSCEMLVSAYYWIHIGVWSLLALYMNHFRSHWDNRQKNQVLQLLECIEGKEENK